MAESDFNKLLSLDEVKAACNREGISPHNLSAEYKSAFLDTIDSSNKAYSKARHILASQCLVAYYLIFSSQAALNAGVAERLVDFGSAQPTENGEVEGKAPWGKTFTGLKVRAGNKTVYPTIPKSFLKYHSRYNEFVKWVLEYYRLDSPNTVFFELNAGRSKVPS